MTIAQLLEEFCLYSKHIKNLTDSTIKRYRENITNYAKTAQIAHISDVNQKNVQSFFFDGRVHRNWKTTTYRTYYMSLLVFFRWCKKNGHLTENYIKDIVLPKMVKSLPKKLTRQEAQKLLEISYNYPYTKPFLKYRNHAIFSMFLFTGLRMSELLQLPFAHVDIENRSLFIRGKGRKERVIPLSSTLIKSLNPYIRERKKLGKTCSEFFVSANLNMGYTKSGLKRLLVQMKVATGIEFKIHELRHTFATFMLEGGCDVFTLSKMMGHSDIKTTAIYLFASAEHTRTQMLKHPLNEQTY